MLIKPFQLEIKVPAKLKVIVSQMSIYSKYILIERKSYFICI